MCGITGFLTVKRTEPLSARSVLWAMTSTLVHRGPDAEGFWVEDEAGIALGHRPLRDCPSWEPNRWFTASEVFLP
jgi:asparagine synthase (glutamine-hydrolysing)